MVWHIKNIQEIIQGLGTSLHGLSSAEAHKRLAKFGKNELKAKHAKSFLFILGTQFRDIFIVILLAAAIVAGFLGDTLECLAIIAIVIINAIIGCVQEYRAEKALQALQKMSAPDATAFRDSVPARIPAIDLVPGDVVVLEAGNIIPADLRLIEAVQLKVDESPLTGESVPVEKSIEELSDAKLPLGDRTNIAFSGTHVTHGRGKGIVVATGMQTQLGKIVHMLEEEKDERTPLQRRLAFFSKRLAIAIFVIVAIIFITGLIQGQSVMLMFLTAVSLAVAAIPEALPAVVTISLALGARKMLKLNALIRKLPAVETLGSVTYICSDKTGTLTQNKMTVTKLFYNGKIHTHDQIPENISENNSLQALLQAMALSNDAYLDKDGKIGGDPTEAALCLFSKDNGFDKQKLSSDLPRVSEIPFDSKRKLMTTFHKQKDGTYISFTKGSMESILGQSTSVLSTNGLTVVDKSNILEANNKLATGGLRVIGIAMRRWGQMPHDLSPEKIETDLVVLGLVGMIDPPREEAKDAVALCRTAGIKPVMITGDHPLTAQAIAQQLEIMDTASRCITGHELDEMPAEKLQEQVEDLYAYARIAPEQKLKIVQALKRRNHFVAMTGDGVNDAPALHAADIGVAMGITGTDVAKEASDMILLNDNFATLVKAAREGRRIYDNILKFITYSLTSNAATLWLIFLAPFFGLPLPLLPIQILWMNLLCDSLPGLALTAEPADANIMKRPPRPFEEGIFSSGRGLFVLLVGFIIGTIFLVFQAYTIHQNVSWQTMLFTALVLGRMAVVLGVRGQSGPAFSLGVFKNPFLLTAILITCVLQTAVVYFPFLNPVFKTQPLTPVECGITVLVALTGWLVIELKKLWIRIPQKASQ